MKKLLIRIITLYQKAFSPDQGSIPRLFGKRQPTCIFYPSCSEYAKEAIEEYGALWGLLLSLRRIIRCNPFHAPGVDPVPKRQEKESAR